MNRRDVLTALAITALFPVGSNAATSDVQPLTADRPASLDLRDAPLHLALEMLLGSYGLKTQMESSQWVSITLKTTDQPLAHHIDLVRRAAEYAQSPIGVSVENGVYQFYSVPQEKAVLSPNRRFLQAVSQSEVASAEKEKTPVVAPRTVLDIPRRVSGLLLLDGWGTSRDAYLAAILEVGEPDKSLESRIVRVGDRIAYGLPNKPDLRVASLSKQGVTLETVEGDIRFLVRLSGIGEPDKPRILSTPQPASKPPFLPLQRALPTSQSISGMKPTPKPKVTPVGGNRQ